MTVGEPPDPGRGGATGGGGGGGIGTVEDSPSVRQGGGGGGGGGGGTLGDGVLYDLLDTWKTHTHITFVIIHLLFIHLWSCVAVTYDHHRMDCMALKIRKMLERKLN